MVNKNTTIPKEGQKNFLNQISIQLIARCTDGAREIIFVYDVIARNALTFCGNLKIFWSYRSSKL